MINWTSFAQNSSVVLSLPALNSGAHFSALLINILCGCLFLQNGALWSVLKTFSGRYFFSSKIFLLVCGHLLSASWSVESVCPVILTFFKQNLFLKLSNYPLLALRSSASVPSSAFYLKLSGLLYGTKHNEKYVRTVRRSLFAVICNVLERQTAHTGMISVTRFKGILTNFELTQAIAIWHGYRITTVVPCVLQLILCGYVFTSVYISLNCEKCHVQSMSV